MLTLLFYLFCFDNSNFIVLSSRNIHVDERAFFPEASGSSRNFPADSYHHQLSMSSFNNKSYPNSHQFQSLNDSGSNPRHQHDEQEQHCFVLGTDFKSPRPSKTEKETNSTETTQRPLHHFFGDQWTQKNTDSWLDLASNSRIHTGDHDHNYFASSLNYYSIDKHIYY